MKYFLYTRRSTDEEKQALSISSQKTQLLERFAGLELIELPPESKSAFKPYNRPVFDEMLTRIENGEAQGIVAWHPDRLSRNPIDGARIIHSLDQGIIKDLKFCSYTYENTPEGKMFLGFTLSQSKYFSDKLGKDVKRGMVTKCEQGHFPGKAPIGYKNVRTEAKGSRYIIPDEERFPLVQQMWHLLLTGAYSAQEIWKIARDDWKLTIPASGHFPERPVTRTCVYKAFNNIFYTGKFQYDGEVYTGEHSPMISQEDFEKAQEIIKGVRKKEEKHRFNFTGAIRCGECRAMITAEKKQRKLKSGEVNTYTYYHCTHRKGECLQRGGTKEKEMSDQLEVYFEQINLTPGLNEWLQQILRKMTKKDQKQQKLELQSLQRKYQKAEEDIQNLVKLFISSGNSDRSLLTDEEFKGQKQRLINQRDHCKQLLDEHERNVDNSIERTIKAFNFATDALQFFLDGDPYDKRTALLQISSNWTLKNGIVECEAKYEFEKIRAGVLRTRQQFNPLELKKLCAAVPSTEESAANHPLVNLWCPGEDSNFHRINPTRPSSVRVYQFRHLGNS